MRKVHYRVVLDVLIHEDEGVNVMDRLSESTFGLMPDGDALDEVADVIDISVEDVQCTDSR